MPEKSQSPKPPKSVDPKPESAYGKAEAGAVNANPNQPEQQTEESEPLYGRVPDKGRAEEAQVTETEDKTDKPAE